MKASKSCTAFGLINTFGGLSAMLVKLATVLSALSCGEPGSIIGNTLIGLLEAAAALLTGTGGMNFFAPSAMCMPATKEQQHGCGGEERKNRPTKHRTGRCQGHPQAPHHDQKAKSQSPALARVWKLQLVHIQHHHNEIQACCKNKMGKVKQ